MSAKVDQNKQTDPNVIYNIRVTIIRSSLLYTLYKKKATFYNENILCLHF